MVSIRRLDGALFLLALLAPCSLSAQVVQGLLVEDATGRPVAGAMVLLVDAQGATRGTVLSDAQGRFTLQAPGAGSYRLRAERVGYGSQMSPALRLEEGEVREHRMDLSTAAATLEGITVQAKSRCVVRPREGMEAHRLWEEARKALAVTAHAQEQALYRFDVLSYERGLEPATLRVTRQETQRRAAVSDNPFRSVPAEQLARTGFVEQGDAEVTFYAPDARVLLSDVFLDGHCFRPQADPQRAEWVGLAFEPVRASRLPDIQGVLWLDRATAELRQLEFTYTRLPWSIPTRHLGGEVEFRRMPNGGWVVKRWWVRMPVVTVVERKGSAPGGASYGSRQEHLSALEEEGGEVTQILAGPGDPLYRAPMGALAGTVWDSTRAAPLAGATVYLSGTKHRATTDAQGRFRIEGLPRGEYTVSFLHPRLDSLGVIPTPRQATLRPDSEAVLEFAVPAAAVLARAEPEKEEPSGPVDLPGVTATGARPLRQAALAAFEERRRRGVGHFLTQEEIRRHNASNLNDVLSRVPGVSLIWIQNRYVLEMQRGGSTMPMRERVLVSENGRMVAKRPGAPSAPGDGMDVTLSEFGDDQTKRGTECPVQVYLDGTLVDAALGDVSSLARPEEVLGVEAYGASNVPVRYQRRGSECGVILIWTRASEP